jgi:acyl carrier protein phosphodiesterase
MNWLAHLYLSEADAECRLGNLLADLIRGKDRERLPPRIRRGFACHQAIDAFTDYHPVTGRSRRRVRDAHGRFAGILVDVFYDHFLARDWPRWSDVPLEEFTAGIYTSLPPLAAQFLDEARQMLARMVAEDRLTSYRELAGIEAALPRLSARIAARLKVPVALESAIEELKKYYGGFAADFAEFFPQLRDHVTAWRTAG